MSGVGGGHILVTGARGYLGGRVVRRLLDAGYSVSGSSRSEGPPPPGWPEQARSVVLSATADPGVTAEALGGVDCIIHLSAANEIRSAADPDAAVFETGVGTRRLLEAAVQAGVARFIHMSTIHVYGAPLAGRLTEASPTLPVHPYAISHRLAESFVRAAHATGRIEGAVVRLSNGIGAPAWTEVDRWSLLGNDLARQAVETGELVLKAPGQWRDFIPLSDVCEGLLAVARAPSGALGDGVFNLGGGQTRRILKVAELLAGTAGEQLGRPIPIRTDGKPLDGAPAPFEYAMDRMRSLGFAPSGEAGLLQELTDTVALLVAASQSKGVA